MDRTGDEILPNELRDLELSVRSVFAPITGPPGRQFYLGFEYPLGDPRREPPSAPAPPDDRPVRDIPANVVPLNHNRSARHDA